MVAAGPALAQEQEGTNLEEATGPAEAGVVDRLHLADNLYAVAVEEGDPILAIAAARLASSVSTEEVERTPETEPLEGAEGEPPEGEQGASDETAEAAPSDVDTMLETARELAGEDEVLLSMVEDIEATSTRGRVYRGRRVPGVDHSVVQARSTNSYYGADATFEGGRTAEVAIAGRGYTDLDLYVFDQNGNLICSSRSRSDREYCRWQPRWTGPFRIEVRNLGYRANPYTLRTN
jgi:hypothetical protein